MLGRQPVVYRDDPEARPIGKLGADVVMAVEAAHHEPAAVQVEQPGRGSLGWRAVDADGDGPVGARAGAIGHRDRGRPGFAEMRAQPVVEGPLLGHGEIDRIGRIETVALGHETPDARLLEHGVGMARLGHVRLSSANHQRSMHFQPSSSQLFEM
jgi:hypothetical protein